MLPREELIAVLFQNAISNNVNVHLRRFRLILKLISELKNEKDVVQCTGMAAEVGEDADYHHQNHLYHLDQLFQLDLQYNVME